MAGKETAEEYPCVKIKREAQEHILEEAREMTREQLLASH